MDAYQAFEFPTIAAFYWRMFELLCLFLVLGIALQACIAVQVGEPNTADLPLEPSVETDIDEIHNPAPSKAQITKRLLNRAEQALVEGHLTQPSHNNAYDSYRAVLLLDSANQAAESGLQAVLLAYSQRFNRALGRGRLVEARRIIDKIKTYYPDSAILSKMRKALVIERSRQNEQWKQMDPSHSELLEFPLPPVSLQNRSTEIVEFLGQLAQRLQASNESVLILARSDAEGRWIYRQLKAAVAGYRVRGDIQLDTSPRIRILPPLQ